jgi:hypothetical protein
VIGNRDSALTAGATVGGLLFVGAGIAEAARGPGDLIDALTAVGLIATLCGVLTIGRRWPHGSGRVRSVVIGAMLAGQIGQAVSAAASIGVDRDPDWVLGVFGVGSVLFLGGLLGITIKLLRVPDPARFAGPVLIAAVLLAGAAQNIGGQAAFGIAWMTIAALLARRGSRDRRPDARVSDAHA